MEIKTIARHQLCPTQQDGCHRMPDTGDVLMQTRRNPKLCPLLKRVLNAACTVENRSWPFRKWWSVGFLYCPAILFLGFSVSLSLSRGGKRPTGLCTNLNMSICNSIVLSKNVKRKPYACCQQSGGGRWGVAGWRRSLATTEDIMSFCYVGIQNREVYRNRK